MKTFAILPGTGLKHVTRDIQPGFSLAQALFAAGAYRGKPLCSGAGRCGLCRVRFAEGAPEPLPEETRRLPGERLLEGWRLACLRPPVPGSVVEVALEEPNPADGFELPSACDGVLGVDLGTTSVHWRFDGPGGVLGGQFPNPQLGAGSEVMARLSLASLPGGAERLREAVAASIIKIVRGLPCTPKRICLAGNTCMTMLALGLDASGLAAAPYRVDWPGGEYAELDARLPRVYIPPLLAPFVGGDVSAGMAALAFSPALGDARPEPPYLLADLGTNGEFALELPGGEVLLASVPMGPALEGVGMAQGMLAGPHAAVRFSATPAGLAPEVLGGGAARGVSGTGYVSLAARLLAAGALTPEGRFDRQTASPLAARFLAGLAEEGGEPKLDVGGASLYASDVEALLKVKAAFNVAVRYLLKEAGLGFAALKSVLLAGALGEHVAPRDLEALGFLPPGGALKVRAVGNTSLEGACLAADREDVRAWLAELPRRSRLVDVAARPGFQDSFIGSMRFTHAG
ncbi:ASKHA domain-containing protein [Fundidesulfovibrio agrisoli]|uniref:ASKHA domain-containing protein n=1 Tax=Fundidesulfovibrio agrisoli TaxID=2922717 RepID=UPI001FAB726F|nr:ASKHA domain-containing protein [Fundidesulfovibrio agrisoli]